MLFFYFACLFLLCDDTAAKTSFLQGYVRYHRGGFYFGFCFWFVGVFTAGYGGKCGVVRAITKGHTHARTYVRATRGS